MDMMKFYPLEKAGRAKINRDRQGFKGLIEWRDLFLQMLPDFVWRGTQAAGYKGVKL